MLNTEYKKRPVRFIDLYETNGWKIKIYSISVLNERVSQETIAQVKEQIPGWLKLSSIHQLETYNIATLILHEGNEGVFALINWWIGENMLQHYVYFSAYENPGQFTLFSDKGITFCVWELAVMWHERNAWVEHVIKNSSRPDFEAYLSSVLNEDV
ncbi:MAG: hypothetical protein IAE90_01770 [Ignavibacteria bacterium]|nr:hypothetical protein [Ignavibacteria bacterium]